MLAPNVGAIPPELPDRASAAEVLQSRVEYVLALAAAEGATDLVLGAWGCGVFRNGPGDVAASFHHHLVGHANWAAHFERIIFAVFDTLRDQCVRQAFKDALRPAASADAR